MSIVKKSSDGFRDNSDLDQQNIYAKFDIKRNNNSKLIFTMKNGDYDLGVPYKVTSPTLNARQSDNNTNLNLKWEQKKEDYDLSLAIYTNYHKEVYDNPDEWGYSGPSQHKTSKTGLDFTKTDYYLLHTLTYGVNLIKNTLDSTDVGEHDNFNKAVFVQDKWEITEPLKLNLGVRYDDHEKFGSEISPRVGAVYTINSNLNLFVSAGKAYRTPTFNKLYWPHYSNPDLKPETAIAYETGLRYYKNNLYSEISCFYRDVKDLITSSPDTNWIPYNVDKAKTAGLELTINKNIYKNLELNLNYTYLDSRDKKTDEKMAASHNGNLGLAYNLNGFKFSINDQLVVDREGDLEDYSIANIKVSKDLTLKNSELKLALGINNLFDEDYQINDGYPMPGRNYTAEVSTTF